MWSLSNILDEKSLGTGASNIQEDIPKDLPLLALLFKLTFLENTTTNPTLANILTQFGSNIEVLEGGSSASCSISPTDLWYLNNYLFGKAPQYIRPGGTDNQFGELSLVLPFVPVRSFARDVPSSLLEGRAYAKLPPKGTYQVKVTYPADANNLDTRLLSVFAIRAPPEAQRPNYTTLIKTFTITAAAIGEAKRFQIPSRSWLHYLMLFHTTNIADGVTSDTRTIESLTLKRGGTPVVIPTIKLEALQALAYDSEVAAAVDDYVMVKWGDTLPMMPYSEPDTPLDVWTEAGDTNAARAILGQVVEQ